MTFEFTFGGTHTTMDLGTLIFYILLVAAYLWLTYWLLSRGIRSLRGKPLNNPPSPIFWAKVTADVLDSKEDEVWHEFLLNDIKGRSGIPNQPRGQMRKVSNFKVEYTYQDKQYQKFVYMKDFSGDAFQLYCLRWNPERTKTYVPTYEWSKAAGVSILFFGVLMVLMGVIVICSIVS